MDLLYDVGEMLATNGRSLAWNKSYPNLRAYHNAMSRLRKSGLVARADTAGKLPHLRLTEQAKGRLPIYYHPEKLWNTKWNGIWYMLIFDVPEKERHYRDTLRGFLKHLRMGCLQKSVWVTPRDIRLEYDDLEQAANVHAISYLLESRTVLHRETTEIVENSWNFDHLQELHERYLSVFGKNLQLLDELDHDEEALMNLLYAESEAYIQCMRPDPLLPGELLPAGYLGKRVCKLHRKIRSATARHLLAHIV
ncbi:MAG: PaaX family transcriptional regulator C-terminal domain-containing protein [Verrucomicrobiota bacterium]|nr:PaaX family transcriptional regulator C-terminal domain-containing protein [Verrucomicrobiota bacterium]